jgi:phosphoglycerol transferase MdoB-like AlkP superfamily enzyme
MVSSGGGPRSTVTTQSWQASPRTTQVSQSIRVVMRNTVTATTDSRGRAPFTCRSRRPPTVPAVTGLRRVLLVTALAAVVANTVLQAPMQWGSVSWWRALGSGVTQRLDLLVLWVVLVFVVALTGRLWVSAGLLTAAVSALAAASAAKMSILTEPVVPSDRSFLTTPGFLVSMVPVPELLLLLLVVLVALLGPVLLGRRLGGSPTLRVGARLVLVAATGLVLVDLGHFNQDGNLARRLYDATGATWKPYSQTMNYRENGVVAGLLYNLPTEVMPEPEGYGEATMRELAQRYVARAAERNRGRDPHALDDVNVVLVLSESFADPDRLAGVELGRDAMPRTRDLIERSWGGEALANFYGTGTSSMEFQALTGQSLALFDPQITSPYQQFMAGMDDYPSAVGWFEQHGHETVAVHPFSTEMYRRRTVYPMLGFDRFVHDTDMVEQDRVDGGEYISDRSAFDEVLHQIDTHDAPLLVNLVTMQNHVPYAGPDQVQGAARGMEASDQALADFLGEVRTTGEKTVVVFYGDHYPGIYPQSVLDANPGTAQLRTPLLIWSSEGQEPRSLPLTGSSDFLPYVFDLLGAPQPAYYELLTEVREQLGALGPGFDEDDLSLSQQALLRDYRLVQYDFSVGRRYAVDRLWYDF